MMNHNLRFFCLILCLFFLSGSARASGTLVSLGDSLARGYGLEDKTRRYSALAAEGLETEEINLGVDGQMALETLEVVEKNREQIEKADIILVSIGANHVLPVLLGRGGDVEMRLTSFEVELQMLLKALCEISPESRILLLTFYNPCRTGSPAQQDVAGEICETLNDVIRRCAGEYGCLVAETADAVDQYPDSCLQADRLHPDETGHRLMAECILTTISDVSER